MAARGLVKCSESVLRAVECEQLNQSLRSCINDKESLDPYLEMSITKAQNPA